MLRLREASGRGPSRPQTLVSYIWWCVGAVDRLDPWSSKDRDEAWVAAPRSQKSPNSCLGLKSPNLQGWAERSNWNAW